MTDIAASQCHVCVADTRLVDTGAQSRDQSGFDRDLAMQNSLQHASPNLLPNAFSSTPAAAGAGNNLMSVGEPGLAHANPALRNVFMQAVENNRDRMAAELRPASDEPAALHATAQSGLMHANPGLRDVFMQAVQNNRDRMVAEVAAPEVAPMRDAGGHGVQAGLEALHHATRDVMQDAIDRQAEALPVRGMMRDGLLGVIDEIENPSPIVQMRRNNAMGPESRLDIDRVEAQMANQLREAIALFDRMGEATSDDTA